MQGSSFGELCVRGYTRARLVGCMALILAPSRRLSPPRASLRDGSRSCRKDLRPPPRDQRVPRRRAVHPRRKVIRRARRLPPRLRPLKPIGEAAECARQRAGSNASEPRAAGVPRCSAGYARCATAAIEKEGSARWRLSDSYSTALRALETIGLRKSSRAIYWNLEAAPRSDDSWRFPPGARRRSRPGASLVGRDRDCIPGAARPRTSFHRPPTPPTEEQREYCGGLERRHSRRGSFDRFGWEGFPARMPEGNWTSVRRHLSAAPTRTTGVAHAASTRQYPWHSLFIFRNLLRTRPENRHGARLRARAHQINRNLPSFSRATPRRQRPAARGPCNSSMDHHAQDRAGLGGTSYAGEMKKSRSSPTFNFVLPAKGVMAECTARPTLSEPQGRGPCSSASRAPARPRSRTTRGAR